ncbi:MAG: hypothetical protein COT17_06710 [Elusimicrobia bacterium CG08_land_8_20_14_0_20_51_18]|nr:MAG: hypothetical protein COT17_06710 [Elusimicrobia bacterium CG08_land_8_20_14_0_20_51_18]
MVYYLELLIAAFFLSLNALFVLVEFAIVKVRYTRIEELAQKGNFNAKMALDILKNLNAHLAAIQLGITMASLGLGWIGEPAFAKILEPLFNYFDLPFIRLYSHTISFGFAFAMISALHIILGEQVPKYIAISSAEMISLAFALPLKIFYHITYYPMLLINKSAAYIVSLFRIKRAESEISHSEDEIRIILGQSEELGKISLGRLMMFEHLFDFGKTSVKEVMTVKDNISFLKTEDELQKVFEVLKAKKLSRYPVLKTDSGKPCGFIHIKDIVFDFANCSDTGRIDLTPYIREIKFINENINLEKALRFFQENRLQIALVMNAKEELTGLLTIEDIIEELTGEIRDEFEIPPNFTLNQILSAESSIIELTENTRFGAIQEMVNRLFGSKHIPHKEELAKKIIEREKSFSTAVGHQVAFPHARVEFLRKPIIAVGKSSQGIPFPSPDNAPVKIIFMILTPFNDPTIQLKILSKLSKLISNVTLRKRLLSAKTIEAVENVFIAFENKIPN